jgi:hypothetical protein
VVGAGHLDFTPKLRNDIRNPAVVSGDDDPFNLWHLPNPGIDALNHRLSAKVNERLAGQACSVVAGRNDGHR